MARKIAVFTGTRAEYGLLSPLILGIQNSSAELQLYVGGMHMSPEFGLTVQQIESDGFKPTEKLEFLLSSSTPVGISKSMGLAQMTAAECIARHQPDIIVILGDRFEALAIAQAAMIAQVPIAHIHGGEKTAGAMDDAFRHAISKMSHIHFTATEDYRRRVIQLGEQPTSVFNVGAPGLDSIIHEKLLTKEELSSELSFDFTKDYILVTYHPVTLRQDGGLAAIENLLVALSCLENTNIVITYPNADTFGRDIIQRIDEYSVSQKGNVYLTKSFGHKRYLSALKHAKVVVGNSSSGIIEAPSLNTATVNIGDRQLGRIACHSVIHCATDKQSILSAIEKACSKEFQAQLSHWQNPYFQGGASEKILQHLLALDLEKIIQKSFYDLPYTGE